jgi:hypothetical protein
MYFRRPEADTSPSPAIIQPPSTAVHRRMAAIQPSRRSTTSEKCWDDGEKNERN